MKRLSVLFMFLAFALGMNAQVEKVFDFNDYQVGSGQPYPPLNGQDGWYVRAHSAGNGGSNMGPMYTDYLGHYWGNTPVTPFSDGGIIELECDVLRQWWGTLFGIG